MPLNLMRVLILGNRHAVAGQLDPIVVLPNLFDLCICNFEFLFRIRLYPTPSTHVNPIHALFLTLSVAAVFGWLQSKSVFPI